MPSPDGSEYLVLENCLLKWTERGAELAFDDGTGCEAWPHPEEPHYHVIAHRCGYGDDLLAYCREHELAHALIVQEFDSLPPVVQWSLAHGMEAPRGEALFEEIAAQTLQRWVRANERPILAGCDWDALKARFLAAVRTLEEKAR